MVLNLKMGKYKRDRTGLGLAALLMSACCSLHLLLVFGGFAVLHGFVKNNLIFLVTGGAALILFIYFYFKKKGEICCNTEIQKDKVVKILKKVKE